MRAIARILAVSSLLFAAAGAPAGLAHGHWSGGGWHGGHWHGGWGWGGWGYPLWGFGWYSPYIYNSPYSYGYDEPPPEPVGGLYCVTRVHLCALAAARAPGSRCSCEGLRGRVSVLQGQ